MTEQEFNQAIDEWQEQERQRRTQEAQKTLWATAQTFAFCTDEERECVHAALMDAWLWGESVTQPPAPKWVDSDDSGEEAHDGDLLTTAQAALYLGVHQQTLRNAALNGRLPSKRRGRMWMFRRADLDEWDKNRINRQYSKPKTVTK